MNDGPPTPDELAGAMAAQMTWMNRRARRAYLAEIRRGATHADALAKAQERQIGRRIPKYVTVTEKKG